MVNGFVIIEEFVGKVGVLVSYEVIKILGFKLF